MNPLSQTDHILILLSAICKRLGMTAEDVLEAQTLYREECTSEPQEPPCQS